MARIEAIEDFQWQRARTAHTQAQRCELDPCRNLRQGTEQRRHRRQQRPLILQDLRNHVLGRMESLHRHHRGPTEQG